MLIKMKELSSTAFDVEDADLLKVEIEKALAKEEKSQLILIVLHIIQHCFLTLVY